MSVEGWITRFWGSLGRCVVLGEPHHFFGFNFPICKIRLMLPNCPPHSPLKDESLYIDLLPDPQPLEGLDHILLTPLCEIKGLSFPLTFCSIFIPHSPFSSLCSAVAPHSHHLCSTCCSSTVHTISSTRWAGILDVSQLTNCYLGLPCLSGSPHCCYIPHLPPPPILLCSRPALRISEDLIVSVRA